MSRRTLRLLALAAAVGLAAACGGDDADAGGEDDVTTSAGDGGGELVVLSAAEVCDAVTGELAGDALGLEVTDVAPAETGATPQCAYTYESATGGPSNFTVAAMDTNAVGERTGDEAFDYVAEINREVAGGAEIEAVEVDAGDRAVRFTGEAIHLGIVAVGDQLLTVIVPLDADAAQVEALLAAVGDAVGS